MKIDMITSSNRNTFRVTGLFVREIHRSPVNSPHKGQWRGALMFSLICAWTNNWADSGNAGDSRWHRVDYDVIVMDFAAVCLGWKDRHIDFVILHLSIDAYVSYQVPHWKSKWDLVLSQTKQKRVGIFISQYDRAHMTILFICKMGSTSQWRDTIVMTSHITVHECLFKSLFAPTTMKH